MESAAEPSPESYLKLISLLPLYVSGIELWKIDWPDFKGKKPSKSPFDAYTIWSIQYKFNKTRISSCFYTITPEISIALNPISWVDKPSDYLLNHEIGHYLLGYLSALEFKKKCFYFNFTNKYK